MRILLSTRRGRPVCARPAVQPGDTLVTMTGYHQPPPLWPPSAEDDATRARRRDRLAMGLVGVGTVVSALVMIIGMPKLADADKLRRPLPDEADRTTQVDENLQPSDPGSHTAGIVLIDAWTPTGAATGTGMILPGTDEILTAYHVVEDAEFVDVELADTGERFTVDLLGYSYERDIALLDIEGDNDLPSVRIDDDGFAVDDEVLAVGNADGQGFLSEFEGTVIHENTYSYVLTDDGSPDEYFEGLIETSAAVVGGVSGGPLFDAENEVIGVVVIGGADDDPGGMAVPVTDALGIVDQVRAGDHSGTVRVDPTASLGVLTLNSRVDESLADPFATQRVDGLMVWDYLGDSAAKRAGLEFGDVITGFDGEPIMYASELSKVLRDHAPGDRVSLQVTRADGTPDDVEVELGERTLF